MRDSVRIEYTEEVLEEFDAIVVGGGPAGSVAAAFLAKAGHRVGLFEREVFPRYHVGESLLPATTVGILGQLGLSDAMERAGFTRKLGGTFMWGGRDEPWTFRFYRTGPEDQGAGGEGDTFHSYQVQRSEFDELLLDRAEKLGARVHQGARVSSARKTAQGKHELTVELMSGEEMTVRAPYVIDASGKNSRLRASFGERHYDPFFKNIAVYRYYEGGARLEGESAGNVLTVAFEHGWFWYIPLSKGLTSVGVVVSRDHFVEARNGDTESFFDEMVAAAPMIASMLEDARPSTTAPYDQLRTDQDYSYVHSKFADGGLYLAGDAACFIDPVFSSGVHLATYAGYLAAQSIDGLVRGELDRAEAEQAYEDAYRAEYSAFYRFLVSFYELHMDPESYFWAAHKVIGNDAHSARDAFVRIVSGQATTGAVLFASGDELGNQVETGVKSLGLLASVVSGIDVDDEEVDAAKAFMQPLHNGRHRILRERDKD